MSWSDSVISTRTSLALACLVATACTRSAVAWNGFAIAPHEGSSRESRIDGLLEKSECFDGARVVIDRSFETAGFEGAPFLLEDGSDQVLVFESKDATLHLEIEPVDQPLTVVERFVPYFFLDTRVPGVIGFVRYTLVCKGGTGRVRAGRDGGLIRGDLALRIACRTYVDGVERDESKIELSGAFRAAINRQRSSNAPP